MVTLGTLGKAALDLLYPPRCAVCRTSGAFLCDACVAVLPRADGARCEVCWKPLRGSRCWSCNEGAPRSFDGLRSAFRYEGDVRRIVRAFKFNGHSGLAPALGAFLSNCYVAHGLVADVVVPVPLTGRRRRTRGYNQALLLATRMAEPLGLPVLEALRRRGHSMSQANTATAEQRLRNVEGVFSVARPDAVAARRVLLIDDVATTGATLNACARQLLAAGARSVVGLTLARED